MSTCQLTIGQLKLLLEVFSAISEGRETTALNYPAETVSALAALGLILIYQRSATAPVATATLMTTVAGANRVLRALGRPIGAPVSVAPEWVVACELNSAEANAVRIADLELAVHGYLEVGLKPLPEWQEELLRRKGLTYE